MILVFIVALFMVAASVLATMNTMFAAVSSRKKELATLRGLILAFQADAALQRLVGTALAKGSAFLLQTLSQTSLPDLPASWRDGLSASLAHADAAVRMEAVRCVATLQLREFDEALTRISQRSRPQLSRRAVGAPQGASCRQIPRVADLHRPAPARTHCLRCRRDSLTRKA